MYWNFGGNFKPVAKVCQYSEWTKCLISFIKYLWFEVVTDVADCLVNEESLWRVLAILLTFTMTGYFIYWKLQWIKEVDRNQEQFTAVNHKIQDLELKVAVITYKMQYGIWPLQYIQETNTLANFTSLRFGFPKFALENFWIENLLTRDKERKYLLDKYFEDFPSFDCDNKLLSRDHTTIVANQDVIMNRNRGCQNHVDGNSEEPLPSLDDSQVKSLIVPPESNLSDRLKNQMLYVKDNIGARNNNLSRRKSAISDNISFEHNKNARDKELGILRSTTNMTVYSKALLSGLQKNICNNPNNDSQLSSTPHDTLLDVQENLNTLYKTIHNYNTKDFGIPMLRLDLDSNPVYVSDTKPCRLEKSVEDKCVSAGEYLNSTPAATSGLKPLVVSDSRNNNDYANCDNVEQTCDYSSKFTKDNKNAGNFSEQKDQIDTRPSDSSSILEDQQSTNALKRVKPLNDFTSALRYFGTQDNGINVEGEYNLSCSETSSESSLSKNSVSFESKMLDVIAEESSIGSSTEKKTDFHDYKIVETNKISRDKTLPLNEKIKRSRSKSISNFYTLIEEKVKKQKETNYLSKVNKSVSPEPSDARVFPSSFSTIFLCNEQGNTDHCIQINDIDTILEMKISQDFINLTGSSSDISVNQLNAKLIENERKLKTLNELLEPRKTTTNGTMQNLTNSDDVKLPNSPIELEDSTMICDNTTLYLSEDKCNINEDISLKDILSKNPTKMECLNEMKNGAEKVIDSVANIKNNEDYNPSEINICRDSCSQCSSISKIKYENFETKDTNKLFSASNINSPIDKGDIYSDNIANEKLIKRHFSSSEQYSRLCTSEESDEIVPSISSKNTQKNLTKYSLQCNNWKPCKAKSSSDLIEVDKPRLRSTHRRSKSYVNPYGITDESQLSITKGFDKESKLNNQIDRKSSSSKSLYEKSSVNSIKKSSLLGDGQIVRKKDYFSPMVTPLDKMESSLELISLIKCTSSKSCIPVMGSRIAHKKSLKKTHMCNPSELSIALSLQDTDKDSIYHVFTDTDTICSLPTSETKTASEKSKSFSMLEHAKGVEQNAIVYCNLVTEDQFITNDTHQTNSSDTAMKEFVADNVVRSKAIDTAPTIPETINGCITCALPTELSKHNLLNSFIPPYKIKQKETEVLVKPSTLDISTSITNLPCVYDFKEGNKMNDLKISEIFDEFTKEECIRYLQMFDKDSHYNESINIYDFCNKLLENI